MNRLLLLILVALLCAPSVATGEEEVLPDIWTTPVATDLRDAEVGACQIVTNCPDTVETGSMHDCKFVLLKKEEKYRITEIDLAGKFAEPGTKGLGIRVATETILCGTRPCKSENHSENVIFDDSFSFLAEAPGTICFEPSPSRGEFLKQKFGTFWQEALCATMQKEEEASRRVMCNPLRSLGCKSIIKGECCIKVEDRKPTPTPPTPTPTRTPNKQTPTPVIQTPTPTPTPTQTPRRSSAPCSYFSDPGFYVDLKGNVKFNGATHATIVDVSFADKNPRGYPVINMAASTIKLLAYSDGVLVFEEVFEPGELVARRNGGNDVLEHEVNANDYFRIIKAPQSSSVKFDRPAGERVRAVLEAAISGQKTTIRGRVDTIFDSPSGSVTCTGSADWKFNGQRRIHGPFQGPVE